MWRVNVLSLGGVAVVLKCFLFVLFIIVRVNGCIFDIVLALSCVYSINNGWWSLWVLKRATSVPTSISMKRAG